MKTLGGASLLGILLGIGIIFWLRPLDTGPMALVLLICVGIANALTGLLMVGRKGRPARKPRKPRLKLILLIVLLGFAGGACKKKEEAPPPVAVRDLLIRDQAPPQNFGAYGYLVFTARPSDRQASRYLAVCEAYDQSLEPVQDFSKIDPASLMVTYWPVAKKPQDDRCRSLLAEYDYAYAARIAAAIRKAGVPGPVLVAWRRPFGSKDQTQAALVLDLSDFQDQDVPRAFLLWKDRLSKRPEVWKDGFQIVLVREMFRNFIQQYGTQIVTIIQSQFKPEAEGSKGSKKPRPSTSRDSR